MELNTNSHLNGDHYHEARSQTSWSVMFEHLYTDITHLLQNEGQLIRMEIREKFAEAKVATLTLVVGAVLLLVGTIAVAATAIILLDMVMKLWIASTIVTATLLLVGYMMISGAQKKLGAEKIKPRQSLETLNEIKTTFKEKINEYRHQ